MSCSFITQLEPEDLFDVEVFLPNPKIHIEDAPADDGSAHPEEDDPETGKDEENSDEEGVDIDALPGDLAYPLLEILEKRDVQVLKSLLAGENRMASRLEDVRKNDTGEFNIRNYNCGSHDDEEDGADDSDDHSIDTIDDHSIQFLVFSTKTAITASSQVVGIGLRDDAPEPRFTRGQIERLVNQGLMDAQSAWEEMHRPIVHDDFKMSLGWLARRALDFLVADRPVWIQPAGDLHPDNWIVMLLRLERHFMDQLEYWFRRMDEKKYSDEYLERPFVASKHKVVYEGYRRIANLAAVQTVIYNLMDSFIRDTNKIDNAEFGFSHPQCLLLHDNQIKKTWMSPVDLPEPRDLDELLDDPAYDSVLRPDAALTKAFDALAISSDAVVGILATLKRSIVG